MTNKYFDKKYRLNIYVLFLFVVGFLVRIPRLYVLLENECHSFRQTQTAITIQNYFRDGLSFFHYEVPVRGTPWEIIFEFPLYQSLVYFFMKIFHLFNIDLSCKIVSSLIFLLSALSLMMVVNKISGVSASMIVGFIYVFSPYELYWGSAALIDYLSVLMGFLYIYCFLKLFDNIFVDDNKNKKYILYCLSASLFGTLGYLQKASTMIPIVLFLFFYILYLLCSKVISLSGDSVIHGFVNFLRMACYKIVFLVFACIEPLAVGVAWNKYSDHINTDNVYTSFLSSQNLDEWFWGSLDQRISLNTWKVFGKSLIPMLGGLFGIFLMIIIFAFFAKKRERAVVVSSSLSVLLTLMILSNLYYIHTYYYIALTPFAALIIGVLLSSLPVKIFENTKIKYGYVISTLLASAVMYFSICISDHADCNMLSSMDYDQKRKGEYIDSLTESDDRILFYGFDWDPCMLYSSDRKGFMVRKDEFDYEFVKENILLNDNYTLFLTDIGDFPSGLLADADVVLQYQSTVDGFCFSLDTSAGKLLTDTDTVCKKIDHNSDGYSIDLHKGQDLKLIRGDSSNDEVATAVASYDDGHFESFRVYFPKGINEMTYRIVSCDDQHALVLFMTDDGPKDYEIYVMN